MRGSNKEILSNVASYYTEKLKKFGESPKGVDWNSLDSQLLRFEQISKVINGLEEFSINDIGCGYGAFYEFLSNKFEYFSYYGCDVSKAMIHSAINTYSVHKNVKFELSNQPDLIADYSVASGLFNVKMEFSDIAWKEYIETVLDDLNTSSRLGFSFNCLTSYSDRDRMKNNLYYADPCKMFDFCKNKYSKNVALLHDYDLYEFTILVKKNKGS